MDWLEWAIRAATVIGGTVFVICALVGAAAVINATRAITTLWVARKKWAATKAGGPAFAQHLRDIDDAKNTTPKQSS